MSTQFQVFPKSQRPSKLVLDIAAVFRAKELAIGTPPNKPDSATVLAAVRPGLVRLGFKVESGKHAGEKIRVPHLFGINGQELGAFEVDAWHPGQKAVVEIEAGIAFDARKFYQDLFEAIALPDVDFLCIAVQNAYHPPRKPNARSDFQLAVNRMEALLVSGRLALPFGTTMILGY